MANIPISSLPEVTTVNDNDYLAVDNGTTSSKIKIGKFNESATASAQAYAAAAAASADAAEGYKDAAQTAKSETQNLITSAQTIVSNAQTYAGNAQTSENNASTYASNASNSASAAANSATQASQYAQGVDSYATEAKSWAQGGTGTRSGEDTDNAKYYSNLAHSYEQDASSAASAAAGSASNASDYKDAAFGSATSAGANALVAEGYATGKQNGEAVSSGTYYHNNAEYFADQASGSATAASNQADRAEAAVIHEPYIGENGNWYVWSWEDNDYVDTEVDATGPAGADGQDGQDGQDGDPGPAGNGIVSITKTSTSGLVDTYTILYTNGDTDTLTVTNGQDGTGSGDMTKADYDSTEAVHDAGGIVAYVAAQLSGFSTQLSGLSDVDLTSLSTGQTLTYNGITQKWVNTSLGTAASCNVPASGNASTSEVVKGDDTRLTDARTPVSHTHTKSEISDFPTLGTAAAKDSTNAVTQNSTDLVESGAVYTEVNAKQNKTLSSAIGGQTTVEGALSSQNIAIANEVETRAKLGAHNLLKFPYKESTITKTPVTFTVNDDGTVTVSWDSTPSSEKTFYFKYIDSDVYLDEGTYVVNGKPSATGFYMHVYKNSISEANRLAGFADGEEHSFTLTERARIIIGISVGTTAESTGNYTVKPMIRLASDAYSEYIPYVPTNAELLSADTNAVLGAHNLVPFTLADAKSQWTTGTWSSQTYTQNGISIQYNNQKLIFSGTNTASAVQNFPIIPNNGISGLKKGQYKLRCKGASSKAYLIYGSGSSSFPLSYITDDSVVDLTITTDNETLGIFTIQVASNASFSTAITLELMITSASDPSTEFTPYAMTNRELTEKVSAQNYSISLEAGYNTDNGDIRVIDGVCYFNPRLYADSDLTVGTPITVGTLPNGCKPKVEVRIPSYAFTNGLLLGVFQIYTNGDLKYFPLTTNRYFGYTSAAFPIA